MRILSAISPYLSFQSLSDYARKNKLATAVALLACVVFALGVYRAVRSMRKRVVLPQPPERQPERPATPLATLPQPPPPARPPEPVELAGPQPPPSREELGLLQIGICMPLLESLFLGSPFDWYTLPEYATVLSVEEHPYPKYDKMPYSIMRGWAHECIWDRADQRQVSNPFLTYRFLAIKMKCTLETETHQCVWVYCQRSVEDTRWHQIQCEKEHPFFLQPGTNHFLYPEAPANLVDRTCSVDKDARFAALRTLLQTGQATDLNGHTWQIPGHPGLKVTKMDKVDIMDEVD